MAPMQYDCLYTGERIPRLGLGTWKMGGGMNPDRSQDERVISVIRAAIELGYTHIDTAEMYGAGHTEKLVGQAIRGFDRERLFITTKVWDSNLRYHQVFQALQGSLERLGIDRVDLYLVHWPNPAIPLEETFDALNEIAERGLARYIGVSNFDLDLLKKSRALSRAPIATDQVPYNLHNRKYSRNGVLRYCQENGILLTAYSPIERGTLLDDPEVRQIAEKYGATPAQIALHWVMRQPSVITIPMSLNVEHLESNLRALELELDPEDLARLDQLT